MVYTLRGKALAQKVHAECSQKQKNNRAYFQYITHLGYFSDSISAVHSSYPLTTAQVENVAHIILLI